jgi:hypothetical protein
VEKSTTPPDSTLYDCGKIFLLKYFQQAHEQEAQGEIIATPPQRPARSQDFLI